MIDSGSCRSSGPPGSSGAARTTGSAYAVAVGAGPTPGELLARPDVSGVTAALWGRWFGGGAIVLPQPMRTATFEYAHDAFALLEEFPGPIADLASGDRADTPGDTADMIGGGWMTCLGYAPGTTWVGFFDHLWRYRDGAGWAFESLGLPDRAAVSSDSLAELRDLLSAPSAPDHGASLAPEPITSGPFTAAPKALSTHLRGVQAVIAGIERGDYYQLNLCTRLRATLSDAAQRPAAALRIFAGVAERLRPAYGAVIDFGGGRAVISLSPELFWSARDGRVRSAPIKGTSSAADDPSGAVLAGSTKDVAENIMITDLMRNDLSRVCRPGTVAVERLLDLEPHPGVWHLVSTVDGELAPGTGAADLLRATFPPGSVTGAPKSSAVAGIASVETQARGAYTGALGFVSPTAGAELSVLIRAFELDGATLELGVGGGITVDSVAILEWYECLHKARPLVTALGAELDPVLRPDPPTIPAALLASGLIETLLGRDGEAIRMAAHLARLDRSCRELYGHGLPADLPARIGAVAGRHRTGRRRIRILVRPDGPGLDVGVESHPVSGSPTLIRLDRRDRPAWSWRHKWADRSSLGEVSSPLEPTVGAAHPASAALTLPYFLTPDGHLAESSRGNLCLRLADGSWSSPPESEHVLPGVTRRDLLRALARRGHRVRVDDITDDDLAGGTALLHCSSIAGVVVVDRLDQRSWRVEADVVDLLRWLNYDLGVADL